MDNNGLLHTTCNVSIILYLQPNIDEKYFFEVETINGITKLAK